jgi:hypothetical protein
MARKAAVTGFISNIMFEDADFSMVPTAEGMQLKDKNANTSILVPARYMIALEKVSKSVKSLYENANPEELEDDSEETETEQDKLEALLSA